MTSPRLIGWSSVVLFVAAWMLSYCPAWAQDESAQTKLDRAIQLYEAQKYEEAQQLVKEADSQALSRADRKRLAQYIDLANTAVDQYHQALSNLKQGKSALEAGKYNTARQLLEQVGDRARSGLGQARLDYSAYEI